MVTVEVIVVVVVEVAVVVDATVVVTVLVTGGNCVVDVSVDVGPVTVTVVADEQPAHIRLKITKIAIPDNKLIFFIFNCLFQNLKYN